MTEIEETYIAMRSNAIYQIKTVEYKLAYKNNKNSRAEVAFFTQQSIEYLLKCILIKNNINYRRTHNLLVLYKLLSDKGINIYMPDYIEKKLEIISKWEVETRYYLTKIPRIDVLLRVNNYMKIWLKVLRRNGYV